MRIASILRIATLALSLTAATAGLSSAFATWPSKAPVTAQTSSSRRARFFRERAQGTAGGIGDASRPVLGALKPEAHHALQAKGGHNEIVGPSLRG